MKDESLLSGGSHQVSRDGEYKYIQELWRKKQMDTLRFLLRVHCRRSCQLWALHSAPCPTGLTKPSKVMSHTGFVCAVVATNAQFLRVQLMASLSIMVSTS
jgi:hypothetical protein